jgi:hypothetical protein
MSFAEPSPTDLESVLGDRCRGEGRSSTRGVAPAALALRTKRIRSGAVMTPAFPYTST